MNLRLLCYNAELYDKFAFFSFDVATPLSLQLKAVLFNQLNLFSL
jgi:hypothetical protein